MDLARKLEFVMTGSIVDSATSVRLKQSAKNRPDGRVAELALRLSAPEKGACTIY